MPSLLATLRPAGALGDQNDATVITHSASRSTPGITLGSYELMSPLIGSVAPAGTIDYLIFFARAQVVLTGAAFQSTAFIRWLEEFGPTTREIEFWTSALTNLDSGQIATMQNGSPWGWSAFVDVALGISGASQHLAGIRAAQTIVAVNADRAAPILEVAHLAVVADWRPVVAALLERLRARPAKAP